MTDTDAQNQATEALEIEHIKTAPDKLFLYVGHNAEYMTVATWLGTELGLAWLGKRVHTGFGYRTYRRPITVRLFGTLYHGWYMESSGDYCRLRKASLKSQDMRYAATRFPMVVR